MRPSKFGLRKYNKRKVIVLRRGVSELWDFTYISVTQNSLQDLKEIWGQWDDEIKQLFYCHYVDLVPTVEEYTTLLFCTRIQVDKPYSRATNILTLLKKLANTTRMSEQWVAAWIKQKETSRDIH
ncbi:hypothetical protein Golob_005806 [Gossypium lobatum]|uniref:Uncharacterized protein n=1 Tax=Gossypium lobatum TaxID=34289 RepID=A0A7J8MUC1_9ROSI|nr:hypothetical protein [Gossypium lobatum]